MKAKQLAQTYLDAPYLQRDETLTSICTTFVNDLHEMLRIRQPTNDAGAIAILRELDTKWRAMSRLTDGAIVDNVLSCWSMRYFRPYPASGKNARKDRINF